MDRKTSFVFYPAEFLASVYNFTNCECATLIKALCEYALYGKITKNLSEKVQDRFNFLQAGIDENNRKYFETCEKRKAGGSKGGRPKREKENLKVSEPPPNSANEKPDKEKDKDKGDEESGYVFIKNNKNKGAENVDKSGYVGAPSVEEVAEYCKRSGYTIDPVAFVRWNEERDWMNGKKYIAVDWRKAVRKWFCKENGLAYSEMETMTDICHDVLSKVKVVPDET